MAVATIPMGNGPINITIDSNNNSIYVANTTSVVDKNFRLEAGILYL